MLFFRLDSWASVGELATLVKDLGPPDVTIEEQLSKNFMPVTLPEDSFLRGYTPLLAAQETTYFIPCNSPIVSSNKRTAT